MITILLADDHNLVRQSLGMLLNAVSEFKIVGETGDGLSVCDLVLELRPDVLVLDLVMPGMNGIDVAKRLSRDAPETKIVMLSGYADVAYIGESLRNGAMAYVLKEASVTDLEKAVRSVMKSERYLSPSISRASVEEYLATARGPSPDPYDGLTTREREVLHLSAMGLLMKQIAARLSISPRTAEIHRANLMRKLGIHSQTELVRYALRRGILPKEDIPKP